jgi:hypothetical protein
MLTGVQTRRSTRANSTLIGEIETTDSVTIATALPAPTQGINAETALDSVVQTTSSDISVENRASTLHLDELSTDAAVHSIVPANESTSLVPDPSPDETSVAAAQSANNGTSEATPLIEASSPTEEVPAENTSLGHSATNNTPSHIVSDEEKLREMEGELATLQNRRTELIFEIRKLRKSIEPRINQAMSIVITRPNDTRKCWNIVTGEVANFKKFQQSSSKM